MGLDNCPRPHEYLEGQNKLKINAMQIPKLVPCYMKLKMREIERAGLS